MKVLVVTKIFPNAREPLSAPFNRQQFAALGRRAQVDVLATIPWFPGARLASRFSAAGRLVDVPARETIAGLEVTHPRFLYVPKLPSVGGGLYAASLLPEALRRRRRYDVVLGSWAWPDGGAAVLLGRVLGAPAVVKLHGSDMNVVARMPGPRRAWSRSRARSPTPPPSSACRASASISCPTASTRRCSTSARASRPAPSSAWIPRGAGCSTSAVSRRPRACSTSWRPSRRRRRRVATSAWSSSATAARARVEAAAAPLAGRVILAGAQPLERVPVWLAACQALVLPSWNEGTPNVLLEALACGRKVIATRVGGCPDVVSSPALGELVPARDPAALAGALARAAEWRYDPAEIAEVGARGGWDDSAGRLYESLRRAVESAP